MQRTTLTILLASFYILGVIAFFTGHVLFFAVTCLAVLVILLLKDTITAHQAFWAYLFFIIAILNSNFQIKDCDDLCQYAQNKITLTGTVLSIPTTNSDDRTKFYFSPENGVFLDKELSNIKAQSIVTVYGQSDNFSISKI